MKVVTTAVWCFNTATPNGRIGVSLCPQSKHEDSAWVVGVWGWKLIGGRQLWIETTTDCTTNTALRFFTL
jgi:hypothetical protein